MVPEGVNLGNVDALTSHPDYRPGKKIRGGGEKQLLDIKKFIWQWGC